MINNDGETEGLVFGATGAKYVFRVVAAVICAVLLIGLGLLFVWVAMDACQGVYPAVVLWAIVGALSIGVIFGGWRIVLSYLRGRVEVGSYP